MVGRDEDYSIGSSEVKPPWRILEMRGSVNAR